MAFAVITLTQKPETKVNPIARFPLREALRALERKNPFAKAQTMAHRSVERKRTKNHRRAAMRVAFFGRKSRRADNHHDPVLVVQQEDHVDSAVDHVDQSTKLGSRKGCVYRPKTLRGRGPFWAVH